MRKIETKKDVEEKRKKNQLIIGAILIFIMLGSTFGVIVDSFGNQSNANKIEYNGYNFVGENGFWTTKIGDYQFMFKYNPEQVERIDGNVNYLSSYSGKTLYAFSEDYVAEVEIYRNLGNIVQRFQRACYQEEDCPEDWPVKDCSNNFIIIKKANESKIYQEQNCVFIEGREENLTQITDEFLFKITGIEG